MPIDADRRARIVRTYAALPSEGRKTEMCVRFVKNTCRCRSISHFLDTAKESNIQRLEGMLYV